VIVNDKLEKLQGCDVRRTGWRTGARRCPVHDEPLELCFDETDYSKWKAGHQVPFKHDDNRIRWHCDPCVGSWLENHFLDRSTSRPARRLILRCPVCESPRLNHR
jgi:Zn finger protein HypA/HybF involved in hydrogenase expression